MTVPDKAEKFFVRQLGSSRSRIITMLADRLLKMNLHSFGKPELTSLARLMTRVSSGRISHEHGTFCWSRENGGTEYVNYWSE